MAISHTDNIAPLDKKNSYLQKLIHKRNKAFLYGWTRRIISLDRKIKEVKKNNSME